MQPKQRMRLRFFLRKNKLDPDANGVIYVRISINGYTQEISLRETIKPAEWDDPHGLVQAGSVHAK
ncbi:MAG: hypothetical protein JST96_17640, partial [Bacteroidetes bacterium]|nr:hypothetical protein [Bacteroidota bacterium]